MQVITCHTQADFDSLASVLAAGKLYPEATMVLSGKVKENVREFLSLYKEYLPVYMNPPCELDEIDDLIVVDTGNKERLGFFRSIAEKGKIKITVYDHHPKNEDSLPGYYENLGANTTFLIEKLQSQSVGVNAFEATLMLLGIYEDTGFLTYANTTARDARAVAWLLEQGASLWAIHPFLSQPLSPEQQELLTTLLSHYTLEEFHRVKVLLAQAVVSEYVGGLSLLAGEISKMNKADAVFLVVEMEKHVYVVGRSGSDMLPVNHILEALGGGGHPLAASATIKHSSSQEVMERLRHLLQKELQPLFLAKDLMSSPVKAVQLSDSMENVGYILSLYGYSGCPVLDGTKVVGMVTRRDTDKALRHGLGHGPVKGFMNPHILTIPPEATLAEILKLMQESSAGRLMVVENEELLGIISRSDVLQIMHSGGTTPLSGIRMWQKLQEALPEFMLQALQKAMDLAAQRQEKLYLVGGVVRDLFMGNREGKDIDLVLEGDSLSFANELLHKLPGQIAPHSQFATATITFSDGWHIDIASTRQEYYQEPAAFPIVEAGSIRQDLIRRDFTINAMAISLNKDDKGLLLDFFGGRMDITARQLKVLHNMSFIEDPTRLLRGMRFACRYGFTWEKQTAILAQEAIDSLVPGKLTPFRIWDELRLVFLEENPWLAIEQIYKSGLWQLILPEIPFTPALALAFRQAPSLLLAWLPIFSEFDKVLFYVMILLNGLSKEVREQFVKDCQLPRYYRQQLAKVRETADKLFALTQKLRHNGIKPSDLHPILQGVGDEGLLYFSIFGKTYIQPILALYGQQRKEMQLQINGSDLKALGFPPGPAFRKVLFQLTRKKIDGWQGSKEEELELAKQMLLEMEEKNV